MIPHGGTMLGPIQAGKVEPARGIDQTGEVPPMGRQPSGQPPDSWGQVGLAMTIPMLLLSGPLVGYGLGWLIRRWTGWGEWVIAVCVLLGLVSGIRESIKVIRRVS